MELLRGIQLLETRYRVSYDEAVFAHDGYFAGDDQARSADLIRAICDPDVRAIVGARGGYGCTRILPSISRSLVSAHPKLLVGLSDLTALHALWRKAGLRSLHGQMVCALGRNPKEEFTRWCSQVEGAHPAPIVGLRRIREGRAEGPLWGGNLAVISALVGTEHLPSPEGIILFLEDVGERPYRVDRMLTSLIQSGFFAGVAGVVLGQFTHCQTGPDGRSVESVLEERLSGLGVPLVSGVPAGHEVPSLELPLGALTRLDATAGKVSFESGAVYH